MSPSRPPLNEKQIEQLKTEVAKRDAAKKSTLNPRLSAAVDLGRHARKRGQFSGGKGNPQPAADEPLAIRLRIAAHHARTEKSRFLFGTRCQRKKKRCSRA